MAPVKTVTWAIPAQTVVYVATLLDNSTQWQQKNQNSDPDPVGIFAILCFIAMGFGYWVGLTKSHEDKGSGSQESQENHVSEEPQHPSKDVEGGENVSTEVSVTSKLPP